MVFAAAGKNCRMAGETWPYTDLVDSRSRSRAVGRRARGGYSAAMAEPARAPRRVQPGGHSLRPEVVKYHQRQRILSGAAAVIAERGYRPVSVSDIVKSAAIARARFYENFSSKQDCFFALYDDAAEGMLERVGEACAAESPGFREQLEAALGALLDGLAEDLPRARAVIVEGPAVGGPINERLEGLIASLAALLRQGRPRDGGPELPESVEETVVGGLYWMLYYALLEGTKKPLDGMLPQ